MSARGLSILAKGRGRAGLNCGIWIAVALLWMTTCFVHVGVSVAAELPETIAAVKPSVVAIATNQKTRSPAVIFFGTGFAVGDGLSIITNAHVILAEMGLDKAGTLGVLAGAAEAPEFRPAKVVTFDKQHDVAILRIEGAPLPALKFGDSAEVREGQSLTFTGFPLGMTLGYHPATHRAMVSAITPIVQPAFNARGLDARALVQLSKSPFSVLQLDGTAYPGNSGSPLYDPATGLVYGIINMVFVKGLKENAISQPSGISYAIPGNFIRDLLSSEKSR